MGRGRLYTVHLLRNVVTPRRSGAVTATDLDRLHGRLQMDVMPLMLSPNENIGRGVSTPNDVDDLMSIVDHNQMQDI